MKYGLLLFVLLVMMTHLEAQILNVIQVDVTSDSSKYFRGEVDFSFETDNRSPTPEDKAYLLTIESATDLIYVGEKNAYYLNGELNYYEATGDPVISTGYIHHRVNFLRRRKLSYETYIQFSFDASRRLDYRGIAGGGVKYQFIRRQGIDIDLGTGFLYEHEKWETFESVREKVSISLVKSSSYFKANMYLNEAASLGFINYYQIGYDPGIEGYRHRVSGGLQLKFDFTSHFSFMAEGSIHYEDKPIIDINRVVYGTKNGFCFTF